MCNSDHIRGCGGGCGRSYDSADPRCQVKVLVGVDGAPNGFSKCPQLGHAPRVGAGKI